MVDQEKYKELFLSESQEHLDSLDAGLVRFEQDMGSQEIAKELMMHSHTLKGIAATMGYGEISNLAHSFEGMVENIKNKISSGGASLLFGAVDELRRLVAEVMSDEAKQFSANPLVDKVGELEHVDEEAETEIMRQPEIFSQIREVKVRAEKLDALVELAAELMVNKLRLQKAKEKINAHFLTVQSKEIDETEKFLTEVISNHKQLINELQYQVLQLRLTQLDQVFNRFPRMMRDLAKQQEKDIEFVIEGAALELDRNILDSLGEPLIHLLRNAVDHGIDKKGVITLSAKSVKDHVVVSVSDDGNGVDWEKIDAIRKKNHIELSREDFLFSGVSTSDYVTEISGRGVGLSVVKAKIESIGGRVEVESENGKGTVFLLHLPVSLAIIKALLVQIAERKYAIPITNVNRLMNVNSLERKKQADQLIAIIDDEGVPLFRLDKILNLTSSNAMEEDENIADGIVILSQLKDKKIGLIVDSVETQQDIIVKTLSQNIRKKSYFSAVTILGDGQPVPIVDLESIILAY
ncbi:MAG: chemotaxis protein CheW [Parcubacteria group bacterium]|jgi:two-component system chemotaxis sensor kinase CheA